MNELKVHSCYEEFTDVSCGDVTRTYEVGLVPVGETSNHLEGVVENSKQFTENRAKAIKVFDKFYRVVIAHVLDNAPQEDISALMSIYDSETLTAKQKASKAQAIVKEWFSDYEKFNVAQIFREVNKESRLFKSVVGSLTEEERSFMNFFSKQATSLSNYNTSRETVLTTLIPKRVGIENIKFFLDNIAKWNTLPDEARSEVVSNIELNKLNEARKSVNDIFDKNFYRNCLLDEDILLYNAIISGKTIDERTKIKGINEVLNELYQAGKLSKKVKLKKLQYQILSDMDTMSFVMGGFDSEEEFIDGVYEDMFLRYEKLPLPNDFSEVLQASDLCGIVIPKKEFENFSNFFTGQYDCLSNLIENKKSCDFVTVDKACQLCEIEDFCDRIIGKYTNCYGNLQTEMTKISSKEVFEAQVKNKDWGATILPVYKELQKLESFSKMFRTSSDKSEYTASVDEAFYSKYNEILSAAEGAGLFKNKIGSFATRSIKNEPRDTLTFDSPELLKHVSASKEKASRFFLLDRYEEKEKRQGYYLAILTQNCPAEYFHKDKNNAFIEGVTDKPVGKNDFRKYIFQKLGDVSRQFPRIFMKESFPGFDEKAYKIYLKNKEAKQNKSATPISKSELEYLISYYIKAFTESIPDEKRPWQNFSADFKPVEEYASLDEFFRDAEYNCYSIDFKYISEEELMEMVHWGYVALFRISGNGFTSKSKKYLTNVEVFKELFSPSNLETFRVTMEAFGSIRFRAATLVGKETHPAGSILVNKIDKNGRRLDDTDEYTNIVESIKGLTLDEARNMYPNVKMHLARYAIFKDNRYTHEQFSIQIPFKFHFKEKVDQDVFNELCNNELCKYSLDEIHVIAVDLGERNLGTVDVLTGEGKLISQTSLNDSLDKDYHAMIEKEVRNRKVSQKAFIADNNIKKHTDEWAKASSSYLAREFSQAPSIMVLENLPTGFSGSPKSGTYGKIYGPFVAALIEKLNLFFDKRFDIDSPGSLRHPLVFCGTTYTAINAALSGKNPMDAQFGFLHFVNPKYTSKFDALTGFFNQFTKRELSYKNIKTAQEFFSKFDDIRYFNEDDSFRINMDYKKFLKKPIGRTEWTLTSGGEGRFFYSKKEHEYQSIDVTSELKNLFLENQIDFTSGENLVPQIQEVSNKDFFVRLLFNLRILLQMRFSDKQQDFILSPVIENGVQYDTRAGLEGLPVCGDTNGAFMIGQKACFWLHNLFNGKFDSEDKKYFTFEDFVNYYQNIPH